MLSVDPSLASHLVQTDHVHVDQPNLPSYCNSGICINTSNCPKRSRSCLHLNTVGSPDPAPAPAPASADAPLPAPAAPVKMYVTIWLS